MFVWRLLQISSVGLLTAMAVYATSGPVAVWNVDFGGGYVDAGNKLSILYVWPVRGSP